VELLVVVLSLYRGFARSRCSKLNVVIVEFPAVVLWVNSQRAYPGKVAHPFRAINSPHRRCTCREGEGRAHNFSLPTRGLALPASESDPAKTRCTREVVNPLYGAHTARMHVRCSRRVQGCAIRAPVV